MNKKTIYLMCVLSMMMMMSVTLSGVVIENFDGILANSPTEVNRSAAGGGPISLIPEFGPSAFVVSGDSLKVEVPFGAVGNRNIQSSNFDLSVDATGATTFKISIYIAEPSLVPNGITVRLWSGKENGSAAGEHYAGQWDLATAVSGWNHYEEDIFSPTHVNEDGANSLHMLDVSNIDAWQVNLNGVNGANGGFDIYIDEILAIPEPATMMMLGLGALAIRLRKARKRLS